MAGAAPDNRPAQRKDLNMKHVLAALSAFVMMTGVSLAAELGLWKPDRANCATAPDLCLYPSARNTGPARGTVLRKVGLGPGDLKSGPGWIFNDDPRFLRIETTASSAIIEDIDSSFPVMIDHPGAIVRNSKFDVCAQVSVIWIRASAAQELFGNEATIANNMIGCGGTPDVRSNSGIKDIYGASTGTRIIRNNIYNVSNGITIDGDGFVIRGNYVHDLGHQPEDHHSAISTHGGHDGVIDFNTVLISQHSTSAPIVVYSGFTLPAPLDPPLNIKVTRNFISGGSYCFFGGDDTGYFGVTKKIIFSYNRLSRIYGQDGYCGQFFGDIAFYSPLPGEAVGNVWDEDLAAVIIN
jgi:hypothetical protein